MRSEPTVAFRAAAMASVTLEPGRWPPSPGFAPWPILISIHSQAFISSDDTPNRPEAICTPRFFGYLPYMSRISPPSPFMHSMSAR